MHGPGEAPLMMEWAEVSLPLYLLLPLSLGFILVPHLTSVPPPVTASTVAWGTGPWRAHFWILSLANLGHQRVEVPEGVP